jgi:hypothetical protein
MTLLQPEYELVMRHDFMAFIERAFYELNPQTPFSSLSLGVQEEGPPCGVLFG